MHAVKASRLPSALREIREAAGLSKQEIADRTGMSVSAVFRTEAGETTPSFEKIEAWARACGRDFRMQFSAPDGTDEREADAPTYEERALRRALRFLDFEDQRLLAEVAAALPGLSGRARTDLETLAHRWLDEGIRRRKRLAELLPLYFGRIAELQAAIDAAAEACRSSWSLPGAPDSRGDSDLRFAAWPPYRDLRDLEVAGRLLRRNHDASGFRARLDERPPGLAAPIPSAPRSDALDRARTRVQAALATHMAAAEAVMESRYALDRRTEELRGGTDVSVDAALALASVAAAHAAAVATADATARALSAARDEELVLATEAADAATRSLLNLTRPTLDDLRELIRDADVSGTQVMWVREDGDVFIETLAEGEGPNGLDAKHPDLRFRCESVPRLADEYGPDAADEEEHVRIILRDLLAKWHAGTPGFSDGTEVERKARLAAHEQVAKLEWTGPRK